MTHANSALEAIQRLVGKVELGLISQVLDTVIHIEKGKVHEILELKMVVRAPTGMESDLSRPVIEIRRFPSGELTHEMFAFGSEIAVVPVGGEDGRGSPAMAMAGDELKRQVIRITGISVAFAKFMTDASAEIYVDESAVGAVVGPGGQNIRRIEQQLGVKLDVKSVRELPRNQRKRLNSRHDDIQDMSEWKTRSGRVARRRPGGKPQRQAKKRPGRPSLAPRRVIDAGIPAGIVTESGPAAPVRIVKDQTRITNGTEVQEKMIAAARVFSDILRPTFGPRGLDKMLYKTDGSIALQTMEPES